MKLKRPLFVDLDGSIFLRAFAIISIVTFHFDALRLPGGSGYLFLLSGYNFVQFTMPKLRDGAHKSTFQFMQPFGRYLRKLLIPSVLYIGFVFLTVKEFHLFSILFVSNFMGPGYAGGISYWFIDVLLQMFIILGLLLAFVPTRRFLISQPFAFFLVAVVVSFVVRVISALLFDTEDVFDRLPHLYFPVFALGGLIAYSKSAKQKWFTSAMVGLVSVPMFLEGSPVALLTLVGGLATLWLPTIKFPRIFVRLVTNIALSSLFIYLCHFQARSFLSKVIVAPHPLLSSAAGIAAGMLFAAFWKKRSEIRVLIFDKLRFLGKLNST